MAESTDHLSAPTGADMIRQPFGPTWSRIALISPAALLIGLFFGLPAVAMLRMSFNRHGEGRVYVPDWTLENYTRLITDPFYLSSIANTALLATAVSTATIILAYPYSLYIWRGGRGRRALLLGAALLPLLISEVSIIVGWQLFFPRSGILSTVLYELGLVPARFSLMFTFATAAIGVTYITLPFAIFILVSTLDGIDHRLLEASADLGGAPLRTFGEILLPLTRGGMLVAFSQAFIWAMGTYATPSALGPDWLWTIGLEIYRQMNSWHNWPFAAALTFLLATSVIAIMLIFRIGKVGTGRFHV